MTELFDLYRDMNKRMLEAQQAALKSGEAMLKMGKVAVDTQKAMAQAAQANQASWRAFLALTGLGK